MDFRNEKLANNIIKTSISLCKDDNLLVEVIGEDGLELGNEIIKQAKAIDANTFLNVINYEQLNDFLINATKEEIIEYGKKDCKTMKKMDAYVGISSPTSDKMLKDVPQEKIPVGRDGENFF